MKVYRALRAFIRGLLLRVMDFYPTRALRKELRSEDSISMQRFRPLCNLHPKTTFAKQGAPTLDDSAIQRLLTSYKKYQEEDYYGNSSMWHAFFETRHRQLHEIFMNGTISEARKMLSNPSENDLFYGFDELFRDEVTRLRTQDHKIETDGKVCLDRLITLAESFGVLNCDNPEYGIGRNSNLSADDIVTKIEKYLGIKIDFPNLYPYEFGLNTNRGIASFHSIHSIYLALRAKQILKAIESPRVLEIGAGLGRSAYYALKFGLPQYAIMDLPFTSISQGYYLLSTLGTNKVILASETDSGQRGCVRLMCPSDFLKSETRYDLVINMDSFTEIDPQIAQLYFERIEKSASSFLSINHEVNAFTTKQYYDKSQYVKRVYRYPYWLRRGYVEELIEFSSFS